MNKKKRQKHSPEFKAKVVLEALKEQKTLSELAQLYQRLWWSTGLASFLCH